MSKVDLFKVERALLLAETLIEDNKEKLDPTDVELVLKAIELAREGL